MNVCTSVMRGLVCVCARRESLCVLLSVKQGAGCFATDLSPGRSSCRCSYKAGQALIQCVWGCVCLLSSEHSLWYKGEHVCRGAACMSVESAQDSKQESSRLKCVPTSWPRGRAGYRTSSAARGANSAVALSRSPEELPQRRGHGWAVSLGVREQPTNASEQCQRAVTAQSCLLGAEEAVDSVHRCVRVCAAVDLAVALSSLVSSERRNPALQLQWLDARASDRDRARALSLKPCACEEGLETLSLAHTRERAAATMRRQNCTADSEVSTGYVKDAA